MTEQFKGLMALGVGLVLAGSCGVVGFLAGARTKIVPSTQPSELSARVSELGQELRELTAACARSALEAEAAPSGAEQISARECLCPTDDEPEPSPNDEIQDPTPEELERVEPFTQPAGARRSARQSERQRSKL